MNEDAIKAAWATASRELRNIYQGEPEDFDLEMQVELAWFCKGYELGADRAIGANIDLARALHSYFNEDSAAHRASKLVELKGMIRKMGIR